jgi:hypothetical protein
MSSVKKRAPLQEGRREKQLTSAREYSNCAHAATFVERRPPVHALEILAEIMRLRVMQEPIGRIFWGLEQRIARLTDEIERRGS